MSNKNQPKSFGEKGLKAIKELEQIFGGPVTVTLGESDGVTETISHYYSGKLPPLTIATANAKREIEMEVSSVEQENNEMLHYLFKNTVESQ